MGKHLFRFGVVAGGAGAGEEWTGKARRAESLGYATLVMPDRMKHTLAPLPALAAAATATTSLRVGTYVIANEFRNPVMLAKEVATLDLLSGGRFELGIGAGLSAGAEDHRMLGVPFPEGRTRVIRLRESLAVLKPLLEGRAVTADGPNYFAEGAQTTPRPVQQPRPPILIAGSGRRLLELAAQEADIVALGVAPTAIAGEVAEKVGWLRAAAGERFDQLELNLNLMAVGQQVPRWIEMQMRVTAADLARSGAIPALTGTTDEMCSTLLRHRESFGISYWMVADELMETFAPVVERLAGS